MSGRRVADGVRMFVVPGTAATAKRMADDGKLDAHCLASIARFKRPKRYVYLDALPKNNYGKVLKTALREMMKSPAGPE